MFHSNIPLTEILLRDNILYTTNQLISVLLIMFHSNIPLTEILLRDNILYTTNQLISVLLILLIISLNSISVKIYICLMLPKYAAKDYQMKYDLCQI